MDKIRAEYRLPVEKSARVYFSREAEADGLSVARQACNDFRPPRMIVENIKKLTVRPEASTTFYYGPRHQKYNGYKNKKEKFFEKKTAIDRLSVIMVKGEVI